MIAFAGLPPTLRLVLLFLLGAFAGTAINLAVERLRWRLGTSHPWFLDPARRSPAQWRDKLPLIGWWTWRRQSTIYGSGFWVRPLFVELLTGALFALLYWWEVLHRGLLGPAYFLPMLPPGVWPSPGGTLLMLHLQYEAHLILVGLMLAASLIDIDDQVIPDFITLPGTLAGLLLAATVPWSLLPDVRLIVDGREVIDFLKLTSPEFWSARWDGAPNTFSLWTGLACYWGWCVALLPRHWRMRHGLKRAWQIFVARLVREPITRLVVVVAVLGSFGIVGVWRIGGPYWAGLITSLVGMAAGGGIIWLVRIIGAISLGKEAMGFGDVTLMSMIGAFLGWQSAVLVFFLAPVFALLIGLTNWIIYREHRIPFGPFLCLAALTTIIAWRDLWEWSAERIFSPSWLMPVVLGFGLALMGVLLGLLRLLRYLRSLASG